MIKDKQALLLDMNSTFMFNEDRFDESQDFSIRYRQLDGKLSDQEINDLIRRVYAYLSEIYPKQAYRNRFPTVEQILVKLIGEELSPSERVKIVDTFAFHELGTIPEEYSEALHHLSEIFTLAIVIDIWSPKDRWLEEFQRAGVSELFSASSFSSDHGMVKPSPRAFELVIKKLGVDKSRALVIGDSIRRDLGGARAAGIDCVLVGGAKHREAVANYANLLDFNEICRKGLLGEKL